MDLLAARLVGLAMAVFRVLPPESYVAMARVLGKGSPFPAGLQKKGDWEPFHRLRRKRKVEEEIRALAKEVFYHLALTGLESLYAIANPVAYLANIQVEGKENLDSALAQGNGVVAVGAHLGPFTALGSKLGSLGFKVNIIINMRNYPKFWKKINDVQRRFGEHPFHRNPVPCPFGQASTACVEMKSSTSYRISSRDGVAWLSPFSAEWPSRLREQPSSPSRQGPLSCPYLS